MTVRQVMEQTNITLPMSLIFRIRINGLPAFVSDTVVAGDRVTINKDEYLVTESGIEQAKPAQ